MGTAITLKVAQVMCSALGHWKPPRCISADHGSSQSEVAPGRCIPEMSAYGRFRLLRYAPRLVGVDEIQQNSRCDDSILHICYHRHLITVADAGISL